MISHLAASSQLLMLLESAAVFSECVCAGLKLGPVLGAPFPAASQPGTPVRTFPKSSAFIPRVHLVKTWKVVGGTFALGTFKGANQICNRSFSEEAGGFKLVQEMTFAAAFHVSAAKSSLE